MTTRSTDQYLVPAEETQSEMKVKGSRFIATILRVSDKDIAEEKYDSFKKVNYKATHNCMAYRIDKDIFRYSDDGEPSGTAGKPILQIIDQFDLKQTMCIVTRYFGGTKLGTGGLIRAYSDAAQHTLQSTKIKILTLTKRCSIKFNYELEHLVRKFITQFNAQIEDTAYSDTIEFTAAVPESQVQSFVSSLIEASNSEVQISI